MKKFEEELKIIPVMGREPIRNQALYSKCDIVELSNGWVSPEDHQSEIGKIELQNLKYREEIARMQKSLRKKNKAIKELNGAVKKSKARLKECEDFSCDANNQAAHEYILKCEAEKQIAELKSRPAITKLKQKNEQLDRKNLALHDKIASLEARIKNQYEEYQEIYSKTAKKLNEAELELSKLKSQLEKLQPEIPEVPLFVEEYAQDCERELSYLLEEIYLDTDYLEDHSTRNEREDLIARYWLYNRTVAKEKRFYLKNKLTGQRLIRLLEENGGGFLECVTSTDKERMQFTQSEIDSMAADSYEKIEVQE